jgi:gas vesicle protein
MARSNLGRLLLVGAIVGAIALLFGTRSGSRMRQQIGEMAGDLPNTLKDLAGQVDMDEVAGVLAERAMAELRPALGDLLKGGK